MRLPWRRDSRGQSSSGNPRLPTGTPSDQRLPVGGVLWASKYSGALGRGFSDVDRFTSLTSGCSNPHSATGVGYEINRWLCYLGILMGDLSDFIPRGLIGC